MPFVLNHGGRELSGRAVNQALQYVPTEDDEVEDLLLLLKQVKVRLETLSQKWPRSWRERIAIVRSMVHGTYGKIAGGVAWFMMFTTSQLKKRGYV